MTSLARRSRAAARLSVGPGVVALALLGLPGCWSSHGEQDVGDYFVNYRFGGAIVQHLPDGAQEVYGMDDGQGCHTSGSMSWIEGDGLTPPSAGEFQLDGYCPEERPHFAFLPATWQQPAGTWGWPIADEVVGGTFGFGEGSDEVMVPLDFTVTVLEATGDLVEPPAEPPADYVRDFTVTAALDCAEQPELKCEGTWSISLEARITADDVLSMNN